MRAWIDEPANNLIAVFADLENLALGSVAQEQDGALVPLFDEPD